ncbi:MAG: mechanosensitive ion channel [Coxiellaceae bacterium]|nr:mechanosensitive ion channel [Coxiellaceae bacterium]
MSLNMYFSDLIVRAINTGFSLVVIGAITLIIYVFSRKKFDSARQKSKFKYRLIYIAALVYLLILVRIWVEGFSHIFTMLSLVAAGLVIANKESLMNITGWFIINWRGLFSPGDAIQIMNITGYVVSSKLLYFKIYETDSLADNKVTGKIIKLPNAMVISNPVTLFTSDDFFMLQKVSFILKKSDDITSTAEKMTKYAEKLMADSATVTSSKAKKDAISRKSLSSMIDLSPTYHLAQYPDQLDNIELTLDFYCTPNDYAKIKTALVSYFSSC